MGQSSSHHGSRKTVSSEIVIGKEEVLLLKRTIALIFIFLWMVVSSSSAFSQEKPPHWEVHFSPHGGCTDTIVRELNKASSIILVQAYSFTSAPIAKGLLNAHRRGVKVEVILDKSQRKRDKYSSADFLLNSGIQPKIDARHSIAHNKVMIIDGEVVMTGSFNFTKAAENSNAENLLIIRDKRLAERYVQNWEEHAQHSKVYTGKEGRT